eukprot:1673184-Ditylum_brightwellii.AAC.1
MHNADNLLARLILALGMVVTRWKDSRVLQPISTMLVKGTTTVQQQTGWGVQSVKCPNGTHSYQDSIGNVDKGDQHRALLGATFFNVAPS